MSVQTYRPTLNAGQVYLRVAGSAAPLVAIGNVSALTIEITEEEKTLRDYTSPGGGQWAAVSRVTGVTAAMTLHDLDPVNLSRALYGDTDAVVGAVVASEAHTAYQRGLIRLANPAPTAVTVTSGCAAWVTLIAYALGAWARKVTTNGHVYQVTVAGTSGASEPIWPTDGGTVVDGTVTWKDMGLFAAVEGTDIETRPEGIMILEGAIPDGCPILVAYTHGAYDVVEALTAGSQVYEMSFGGLNEANSNSPVVLDIYRLQIGAASSLSLLGDEFASLSIKGKVLLDASKTGTGISRYFRVQMS